MTAVPFELPVVDLPPSRPDTAGAISAVPAVELPVRQADVDPTFIQRLEVNAVVERTTRLDEGVVWPTDEPEQRMWALSMAIQVLTRELYLSKDEAKDVTTLHVECAERIRSYINGGTSR